MKVFSNQTTSEILQALLGPGGPILNLVELLTVFAPNEKKKLVFQRFRVGWIKNKREAFILSVLPGEWRRGGQESLLHHSPEQRVSLPMPSAKIKLKISFLAKEFPNCHTKPLHISSTRETRSEQTVLLVVSLTSKGLSQPITSWAGPSGEACASLKVARRNPSYPQHVFIKFVTNSLEIWEHLTTFCTSRDTRTRETALAPGRSWFSSSLEARAASFDALPIVASTEEAQNESHHEEKEFANLVWNIQMKLWGFSPCSAISLHAQQFRVIARCQAGNQAKGKEIYPADMGRVCQPWLCPKNWGKRILRDWKDHLGRAP